MFVMIRQEIMDFTGSGKVKTLSELCLAGSSFQGIQNHSRSGGCVQINSNSNLDRRTLVELHNNDTALVIIDPQNDVLSEHGVSWGLVGASVQENNTIENLERLFATARERDYGIFISPHYLYPFDQTWRFTTGVEKMMLSGNEFARPDPLSLDGFPGSGADWLERYKPYIQDERTVVVSPHKLWGPQTNDLVFQLRKRQVSKVILAGMLANLCVESHLRELLELGFEVAVVKDATAGPRHPELGDGYQAAIINFGFLAHAVLSTDDTVRIMR